MKKGKRKPRIIRRTSFNMAPQAHALLKRITKLEHSSVADAIEELLDVMEILERDHGELFPFKPYKSKGVRVRHSYAMFDDTLHRFKERTNRFHTSQEKMIEFVILKVAPMLLDKVSILMRTYLKLYGEEILPLWKRIKDVDTVMSMQLPAADPLVYKYRAAVGKFEKCVSFVRWFLPDDVE